MVTGLRKKPQRFTRRTKEKMPHFPVFGQQSTQRQQQLLLKWTYGQLQLADLATAHPMLVSQELGGHGASTKIPKESLGPRSASPQSSASSI